MIYNIFVIQDAARYVSTGGIFRMYIYGYTFDDIFETPQCDVSTTFLYAGHHSAVLLDGGCLCSMGYAYRYHRRLWCGHTYGIHCISLSQCL